MNLEPLEVLLKDLVTEQEAEVCIDITERIAALYPEDDDEELTDTMTLAGLAISYMYVLLHYKGFIPEAQYVIDMGIQMHNAFLKDYQSLKPIEKMKIDEFNEFMKQYDGRLRRYED